MNPWLFLPFCPEDLDSVTTIEVQSFAQPWERSAIKDELANPDARAFILKPEDRSAPLDVGAYIFLRIRMDQIRIVKLAVAPEQRRQGLASRLATQALAQAAREGCAHAILEVRRSNSAAFGLYARLGFETIGERKCYYLPAGEDALVMAKNLKEIL